MLGVRDWRAVHNFNLVFARDNNMTLEMIVTGQIREVRLVAWSRLRGGLFIL